MTSPLNAAPLKPEDCNNMQEVRAGVNAVDARLVALLAERFGYMAAAARIKPDRDMVRDEPRKAEVIAQAVAQAEALGLPGNVIGEMWETLVEGSIAYEMAKFDALSEG